MKIKLDVKRAISYLCIIPRAGIKRRPQRVTARVPKRDFRYMGSGHIGEDAEKSRFKAGFRILFAIHGFNPVNAEKTKQPTENLNKKVEGIKMNNKHLTNQTITFEGDEGVIRRLTRFKRESSSDWNRRYHEACNDLQGVAKRAKLFDGTNHDTIYFN